MDDMSEYVHTCRGESNRWCFPTEEIELVKVLGSAPRGDLIRIRAFVVVPWNDEPVLVMFCNDCCKRLPNTAFLTEMPPGKLIRRLHAK